MSAKAKDFGVALCGVGTVGGGVFDLVEENSSLIADRSGLRPVVISAAARNIGKAKERTGGKVPVFDSWQKAIEQPGVDAAIELMGGIKEPLACVKKCGELGLPLVTANKALLATHGEEILGLGTSGKADIYFEAAVAGCIPAIRTLRDSLAGDRVVSIMGIVNGTCNYILSRMASEGIGFSKALAAATEEGYAEADPSLDIDGHDAAHKAVIMSWLAFGTPLAMDGIEVSGIRDMDPVDEDLAAEFGYVIKLIAMARRDGNNNALLRTCPALVDKKHSLAKVDGSLNAILIESSAAGELMLVGAGAGARPTASAVLSDIIEAGLHRMKSVAPSQPRINGTGLIAPGEITSQAYLRLPVVDTAGVIAKISSILADREISIEGMHQGESKEGEQVDVALLLHDCKWQAATDAAGELTKLEETLGTPVLMPIAIPHNR